MEKKKTKKEIVKMLLNQNLETEDEEELIDLLIDNSIAVDVDKQDKDNEKFGDRVADKITEFAGSWGFILGFTMFLILWIIFVHSIVTFWETRIEAVFYSYGARVYTEKLPHAHAPAIIRSRREAPCL